VKNSSADFYDCKSDVEGLLALSLSGSKRAVFKPSRHPALHPGQSADIFIDNQVVGNMGALHPRIGRQLDMENMVWLFELDLAAIIRDFVPKFTQLSRFPSIRRDLSLVVPEELPAEDLLDCIRETVQDSLHKLELFDVYRGEGIDSGKKSLAIGLTFQESSRTLIDSEVDALIEQVLAVARGRFGAKLRQ
jgi:phenylalanyl-tRNA synthetase beta chain